MKKYLPFLAALLLVLNSYSAPLVAPAKPTRLNANEVLIPVGKSGQVISLMQLSTIKLDELQKLTGQKISFFERLMFKSAQKKLRSGIAADGTINSKKLNKAFSHDRDVTSGFHLGGFALGLLLFLIGVLIAYLINDENHAARVKWAWIGAAIAAVIYILIGVL